MNLGEIQLGAGQFEAAARTLARVAALEPGDWLAHYYLARAEIALERFAEADAAVRRALERTLDKGQQRQIWSTITALEGTAVDVSEEPDQPSEVENFVVDVRKVAAVARSDWRKRMGIEPTHPVNPTRRRRF